MGLLVVTLISALVEDLSGVYSQRAVHINGEIREIRHHILLFDLPDIVQQDLGPSNRKGRDHDIAASVESLADYVRQVTNHVHIVLLMDSVPVRGFHDDIIRLICIFGILEQGLAFVSDVSGKDNLLLRIALLQPQLNTGGTQQVTDICKAETDPVTHTEDLAVGIMHEQFDRLDGVLHGVNRLIALSVHLSLGFLIAPLSLHCLDVGRIAEHDIAQACCRCCGNDLPAETVMIQLGKHSGMVDMRMCKENKVDLRRRYRQVRILEPVNALFHTAVYQKFLLANLQIMAAARHFMVSSDKH